MLLAPILRLYQVCPSLPGLTLITQAPAEWLGCMVEHKMVNSVLQALKPKNSGITAAHIDGLVQKGDKSLVYILGWWIFMSGLH